MTSFNLVKNGLKVRSGTDPKYKRVCNYLNDFVHFDIGAYSGVIFDADFVFASRYCFCNLLPGIQLPCKLAIDEDVL